MSVSRESTEAIFSAALCRPPTERAAYLDRVCAGAPELRARVEALLAADERAGDFLATPLASPRPPSGPPAEEQGQSVGPYRLAERLGEGGFGVVWRAEQEQPVRREVALKVLKPGMDTAQVIARFEAERQALAMLDHENIARVLDAGATPAGRPYFVMELVRGTSLCEYCDRERLGLRERVELFLDVCRGVQHAHQKGLIHRDLKPTNVLVAEQDGRPVPKVIDFGIAKATQGRLTARTLHTERGQLMGTPLYMSPEQAAMSERDVDTRADIFSLGAMLYELLTGTTPLEARRLREAGLAEVQRLLTEEEPPAPSQRVARMGPERKEHALRRRLDPSGFPGRLRGDLDWVVLKAIDKEPARRYASADALAADLRRHLASEPVQAGPPTAGYLLRKFARRHRAGVLTSLAVLAALVIGAGAALSQFLQATEARDRAEVRGAFLQELLDGEYAGLSHEELVAHAERHFGPDHAVVATVLRTVAEQARGVGDLDRAEAFMREEIARLRAQHGERHLSVALAHGRLGSLLLDRGEIEGARADLERALALGEALPNVPPGALAEVREQRAELWRREGRFLEASEELRRALAERRSAFPEQHDLLGRTLELLAERLSEAGRREEAARAYREAIAEYEKAYPDSVLTADRQLAFGVLFKGFSRPQDAERQLRRGIAFYRLRPGLKGERYLAGCATLADVLAERQDEAARAEARALCEEAAVVARRVHAPDSLELAEKLLARARALERLGDEVRAAELNREAFEITERALGEDFRPEAFLADMNRLLRSIAQREGAQEEAYQVAARLADLMLLREPGREDLRTVRQFLDYRLRTTGGEGLASMAREAAADGAPGLTAHPLDLARLAMVYERLRDHRLARLYLARAREQAEAVAHRDDPLVQSVLREASAMIER